MKIIYKYQLNLASEQFVVMPMNAEILKVAFVGNDLFLWALISTNMPFIDKRIAIVGTGQEMKEKTDFHYIDTVFQGEFVWHVFEAISC